LCLTDGVTNACEALSTLYFVAQDEVCERGVSLCEPGLVCESSGAGNDGVCRPTVSAGATCRRAEPNQCPANQYCDAETGGVDGTCQDLPGDGEPCLTGGRNQVCAQGTLCASDTCVERRNNGGGCEEDRECFSGNCDAGTCLAPLFCEAP
jgi:hypothetical protein